MLKRVCRTAATALCGLTLGLVPLSAAHAANTLLAAQAGSDPVVIGWVDTSQGIGPDQNVANR